jgi:TRAP-type C4-dicarboxylate transport system substrate-binding protein
VYCTELPLMVIVVAALFWTTAATRASARECRSVDVQSEHYPPERTPRPMARAIAEQRGLTYQISIIPAQRDHSRQQVEATGVSVVKDCDRKPFQATMAGLYRQAALDPAAPVLIARMRQVE